MGVYQEKLGRDMHYSDYKMHVEASRNRRLIQAIEFESARQKKNKAMLSSLAKKWDNMDTRIVNKLAKVLADIDMIDDMLVKFAEINNQITLLEE